MFLKVHVCSASWSPRICDSAVCDISDVLFKWLRPCRRPLGAETWIWLKYGRFGLREVVQTTRRARRIHLHRVSAQTEPPRPISRPKPCFCATGSNSGDPGSQEISPLKSRTALEQRCVSWGSHLSVFCFEQSHGDLFRDQHVPHIELNLFLASRFRVSSIIF